MAIAAISTAAATLPGDDRAILHVLSRTTFGPRPGDLERVRSIGIQRYIDEQLRPERIPDAGMPARLAGLTTIGMSSRQIAEQFELPQLEARRQRKAAAGTPEPLNAEPGTRQPPNPMMQRANGPVVELSQQ